jgi:hypothetical protein
MTNQVITSVPAVPAIPAIGQAAGIGANSSDGIVNYSSGKLTGDGGTPQAVVIPNGFVPRYFVLLCIAGTEAGQKIEWFDGMADGQALVSGPGTTGQSISTTLGPTVLGSAPLANPLNTITVPATALAASSTYVWQAQG